MPSLGKLTPTRLNPIQSRSNTPTPTCQKKLFDYPTSSNSHQRTPSGLRSLFNGSRRGREPGNGTPMPSSKMTTPQAASVHITPLTKAFVESLTSQKVSDFLIWLLYYDVVEIPAVPEAWYLDIGDMEMTGWVALGNFLSKNSTLMGLDYGLDLVVLDSICDRLQLRRSTVHSLVIQFADPRKMAHTQVSTVLKDAERASISELEALESVEAKLRELNRLVSRLKPSEGSKSDVWQPKIMKRTYELVNYVTQPRIIKLRSKLPFNTPNTAEPLPVAEKEGVKHKYQYEAIQLKRLVPLHRYGISDEPAIRALIMPPSSSNAATSNTTTDSTEVELARNHAIRLMSENHALRAQVETLQAHVEKLETWRSQLNHKVDELGDEHLPPPPPPPPPTSNSEDEGPDDPFATLTSELEPKLAMTPLDQPSSDSPRILSRKYMSVFSSLDESSTPILHLSNPMTGGRLADSLEPLSTLNSAQVNIRRSGLVFSEEQKLVVKKSWETLREKEE